MASKRPEASTFLVQTVKSPNENDIFVASCAEIDSPKVLAILFLGDLIEKTEMPENHEIARGLANDPKAYALSLVRNYKNAVIVVVRASSVIPTSSIKPKTDLVGFAKYKNFVPGLGRFGDPGPLSIVASAPVALVEISNIITFLETQNLIPKVMNDTSLEILGFSKGGVVITRLIQELLDLDTKTIISSHDSTKRIISSLKRIHFVDCGHNGATSGSKIRDVFPTVSSVSKSFMKLCNDQPVFFFHGSPRQWEGPKKYVSYERDKFMNSILEFGFKSFIKLYGEDGVPSLEQHFRILTCTGYYFNFCCLRTQVKIEKLIDYSLRFGYIEPVNAGLQERRYAFRHRNVEPIRKITDPYKVSIKAIPRPLSVAGTNPRLDRTKFFNVHDSPAANNFLSQDIHLLLDYNVNLGRTFAVSGRASMLPPTEDGMVDSDALAKSCKTTPPGLFGWPAHAVDIVVSSKTEFYFPALNNGGFL
eukprot:UC4_evm1s216